MTTTFLQVKQEILRLLDDEVVTGSSPMAVQAISAALMQDAVNAALESITTRIWKRSTFTITTETTPTATRQYTLPSDVIDIEAIYDANVGQFIPRLELRVGSAFASGGGNAWLPYPSGSITFTADVEDTITGYYAGAWTQPTGDTSVLDIPDAAIIAIVFFAASYCRLPSAASAANIRQYNTKVDSGQPTDNPVAEFSDFLLKRYEIELARIPMMQRERR